MEPIRVLIADDHTLVREGTRRILQEHPEVDVVGEAGDGVAAVQLVRDLRPDVLILDIRMPRLNGVQVTEQVLESSPSTRVLILTAFDDDDYILALMQAGASGYLLKTTPGTELLRAVQTVYGGETVLHPEIARKLATLWLQRQNRAARGGPHEPLTPREAEVLRLVARGLRNKEVAQEIGMSVRTVEAHLKGVFNKLGVSSRTEAVMFGVAHHLFPVEDGQPSRT